MKTEFCFSNKLVRYIFQKIECEPDYVFREAEIKKVDPNGLDLLNQIKLLNWKQFDYEHDLFFSSLLGDQANPRHLTKRTDGKYWADPEEIGLDRIIVTEEDIPHWSFDIQPLLKDIKSKNNLSGSINTINARTHFIGVKTLLDKRIGIILCLLADDEQAEAELLTLKSKLSQCDVFLVLCPFYTVKDQGLINKLQGQTIFPMRFEDVFKDNDFIIDNRIFQKMYLPDSELKGKKVFVKYHTPAGTKWEDVTIQLVTDDSIKIIVNGESKIFTYPEIGFKDTRKGNLWDSQWVTLRSFAEQNGEIAWGSKKSQPRLQKKIQAIRRRLETLMGINGDPFCGYNKRLKAYRTRFKIEDCRQNKISEDQSESY